MTLEQQQEVKDLIAFYDERNWDWGMAACYTLSRALGLWPPQKPNKRHQGGWHDHQRRIAKEAQREQ